MAKDELHKPAKTLYLQGYKQNEIADKLGVSTVTISTWKKEGKWDILKTSTQNTKDQRLCELYQELEQLNSSIKNREEGTKYATSQEADIRRKLIKDIADLEKKYSISEAICIAREFSLFVATVDNQDFAKKTVKYFDSFINDLIQKQKS